MKCFLIDDLTEEHVLFKLALDETGLPVDCYYYHSAREALAELKGSTYPMPDVIFVDMNMPGMDGYLFLRAIKNVDRLKNIPVYIFTVIDDPLERKQALRLGAADYVVKCTDPEKQTEVIKDILTSSLPGAN